jgi:mannose-6-phosphate isomerase-like protein (cupin superfamily)
VRLLKLTIFLIAIACVVAHATAAEPKSPVAYVIDHASNVADVPINLPAEAENIVVAKVRFLMPAAWLGGRHCEGCTDDILFTRIKITEVKRGSAEIDQVFDVRMGLRNAYKEYLPIPTRPINVTGSPGYQRAQFAHFSAAVRMEAKMTINDIGPKPQSFNIEHATKENTDYRSVAWSGRYLQVTLMSIPVGEDIGLEAHPETDQFLRLDAGSGRVQMGAAKDKLTFEKEVSDGWCVLVPAGTWHNITNIGATPMQVYAIYAPAHHKPGKVQATAAAAEADKDDEPAAWSVQPKHAPDKHG